MIGKVNDDFFQRAILPSVGAPDPQVVVGPKMGVDAEYITRLVCSISESARELGITIVGGHTGFYGAVAVPTIGGATVWGVGESYITPAQARVGDAVIITRGAAVEAGALLGSELAASLRAAGVAQELVEKAAGRIKEMTVVQDALLAASCSGVHAMHDATEGGLARGLWEVAEASGVGLKIERERIMLPPDIEAVCRHFGLNPYEVISEGTLVLTAEQRAVGKILQTYADTGIPAAVIGEIVPLDEGRYWIEADGHRQALLPPPADRFWEVFFSALEQAGEEGQL